jgi:hypothetical protein
MTNTSFIYNLGVQAVKDAIRKNEVLGAAKYVLKKRAVKAREGAVEKALAIREVI